MSMPLGLRIAFVATALIAGFYSVLPVGLWLLSQAAPLLALVGSAAYFTAVALVCRYLSSRLIEPDALQDQRRGRQEPRA
jgi:membrane protein implicated in regulation of membrane protease activity